MARTPLYEIVSAEMRRLGVRTRARVTARVRVGSYLVSGSRAEVEGLPWLHLTGTTQGKLHGDFSEGSLVAALCDRVPVTAVVDRTNQQITRVVMPGWAFAAFVRLVAQCDPKIVQTTLSEYLPLAMELSTESRTVGSAILQALEEVSPEPSSSSDSSTDWSSTK